MLLGIHPRRELVAAEGQRRGGVPLLAAAPRRVAASQRGFVVVIVRVLPLVLLESGNLGVGNPVARETPVLLPRGYHLARFVHLVVLLLGSRRVLDAAAVPVPAVTLLHLAHAPFQLPLVVLAQEQHQPQYQYDEGG